MAETQSQVTVAIGETAPVELSEGYLLTDVLLDEIAERLQADEQLLSLVLSSEEVHQVKELRDRQFHHYEPIRIELSEAGTILNQQIDRRAKEIAAKACAEFLRGDDSFEVDVPDEVDSTFLQSMSDAKWAAQEWLKRQKNDVSHLQLRYPRDTDY